MKAFKSSKLRVFADDLRQLSTLKYDGSYSKLYKGIAWDKIPDKDIKILSSGDENLKTYINDDSYTIVWVFVNSTDTIKYKSPSYNRYRIPTDRSTKTRKGALVVTRGRKFLTNTSDLSKSRTTDDKYEKPFFGDLSVLKLASGELSADCIIIKNDVLLSHSTTDLRNSRATAKSGATALQKSADILYKNQERYRKLLSANKVSRKTKKIDDMVTDMLKELKDYMATEVSMSLSKLLTVKPYTVDQYNKDYNREVEKVTINEKALDRLKAIVELHRTIINQYDDYLYNVRNDSESKIQQSIDKLNALKNKIEEL